MIGQSITVKYEPSANRPDDVVDGVGAADLIAFERRFDLPASALGEHARIEWLAFICWNRLRRTGSNVADFDAWLDLIASLEVADEGKDGSAAPEASTD